MIYGIAFAVGALVGLGVLIWMLSRGSAKLTVLWAVFLVLAVGIAMMTWNISSIYYHMPVGWMVALGCAVLVVIALFALVGKSVSWKLPKVLAAAGVLVLSFVLMTIAMIALPTGTLFAPLFEARGEQIAADNGFTPLFAPDTKLKLDYLPVDAIGPGNVGLSIMYEGFAVEERKAEGELSMSDLKAILAKGEKPLGYDVIITSNATYEELEVGDRPALGVEFAEGAGGGDPKKEDPLGKQSTIRILAFEKDGVDVRIESQSQMEYMGGAGRNEQYEFAEALTFEKMVAIGESLAPKP